MPQTDPIKAEYPDKNARRPAAFLMICHGFDITQNKLMQSVALKMLMYLGQRPLTSLENGYVPAAIWFPIVARMKEESSEEPGCSGVELCNNGWHTANRQTLDLTVPRQALGMTYYHSNSPQI